MNSKTKSQDSLVSVIVPVYNTAKYLPSCLDSILNQTYQNLEIIIIDDGSTDHSPSIIKSYIPKDPRIKVITQKNQGLSAARNSGLKKATGQYITFVDSDDTIDPNMLQSMVDALQKHHADIAACSFKEIYPSGKVVNFNRHNFPMQVFPTSEALTAMLEEHGFMVSSTMKLYSSDLFKGVKFPTGKLHEDVGTTYKLIMKATKIVFLPQDYYNYYHHEDSIISHFNNQKFDLITLTDKMCDDIDQKFPELQNVTRERRMRARFSLLRQIPLNHPRKEALLSYLKSHKSYITKNPAATKTDKIALKLALASPKLFQLAYKHASKSSSSNVKTSKHAVRYFFVGVGVTLFYYVVYAILSNLIIKNNDFLWLSAFIATAIATIVAYFAHSKITWKERHVTKHSIIRFFIWNAILAIAINPGFTQLFSLLTPLYEFAFNIFQALHVPFSYEFTLTTGAFVLTAIVTMILNFLFYDKFVFGKTNPPQS